MCMQASARVHTCTCMWPGSNVFEGLVCVRGSDVFEGLGCVNYLVAHPLRSPNARARVILPTQAQLRRQSSAGERVAVKFPRILACRSALHTSTVKCARRHTVVAFTLWLIVAAFCASIESRL